MSVDIQQQETLENQEISANVIIIITRLIMKYQNPPLDNRHRMICYSVDGGCRSIYSGEYLWKTSD